MPQDVKAIEVVVDGIRAAPPSPREDGEFETTERPRSGCFWPWWRCRPAAVASGECVGVTVDGDGGGGSVDQRPWPVGNVEG
jgi:hypothetical protein